MEKQTELFVDKFLGREVGIDDLSRAMARLAQGFQAPVVGAFQLTCADESEHEMVDSFQKYFSDLLLPSLKYGERSAFRLASLGGRYEWGAVQIAEDHFATEASANQFKVMVVKVNSHVAVDKKGDGVVFGSKQRYDQNSTYCGALHALLGNGTIPFRKELVETFSSEGIDRLAALRDPETIDPHHKVLFAAIANARLQARQILIDIQNYQPKTPTLFLIFPCVTLNVKELDHEILCGAYEADCRTETPYMSYLGFGDDPSTYRLSWENGNLLVKDPVHQKKRSVRDHRKLVFEEWKKQDQKKDSERAEKKKEILSQLGQSLEGFQEKQYREISKAKPMLKILLKALARLNPVTAAIMLFSEGLIEAHHLYRVHQLARDLSKDDEARVIIDEFQSKVDALPPEKARDLIDLLVAQYQ